ncbi:LysR family transcriptional regulator [Actinomycetospora endophytica]|uniref:LysR family transcriptional regulator n=1 Tax=Actinomycetospora endophytica TaxID=2291215 RepID=A0ABS8PLF9_9PSEU|nr:LysR family transcriptional regulator [Actinomycetospora endophytica]MCD2197814.1 LysR family transcriptional regulator [Actinomycetospora endophytica]
MDTRRLPYLVELARLGSMRAVAETLHTSTSSVSQQIAALAHEAGAPLVEPDGRRVRLTPAGRRLAEHAVEILAAVDSARHDLEPHGDPAGTVRVAGFATAVRRSLMPIVAAFADEHPRVRLTIREHEPTESLDLLDADAVDLALVYDYDLAPSAITPPASAVAGEPLWEARWGLGVPDDGSRAVSGPAAAVVGTYRHHDWIGNSRNRADEDVVRLLASTAGFEPRMTHEADSLDLVEDLVVAGLGVGLLPVDRPVRRGVRVLELRDPEVRLRCRAVTRRGRDSWPPLALVLAALR